MSARRGEGGFVLVFASVLGLIIMGVWAAAYRASQDAIAVEGFHDERARRDRTVTRALAEGLALLETGAPPSDPYACVVTVADGAGGTACTVTFVSVIGVTTFDVSATVSTAEEIATLPAAPESF